MRYSKEHKQETHAKIVKKAAILLREKAAYRATSFRMAS